jgi:DNA-binding PadR family transcriptional regulator
MSLKHAILGLLTIQPMTGYELKHEAFDVAIAHFWQADQSQIYRTLDRMESDGWVESELELQTERPNKRRFQITAVGREALLDWLHSPQPPPVYREPFLVQLFFAGMLPCQKVLEHIQQHIAAHRATLDTYRAIEALLPQAGVAQRDQQFWRMTLDLGVALEKTYLEWLENCRHTVEAMTDNEALDDQINQ